MLTIKKHLERIINHLLLILNLKGILYILKLLDSEKLFYNLIALGIIESALSESISV